MQRSPNLFLGNNNPLLRDAVILDSERAQFAGFSGRREGERQVVVAMGELDRRTACRHCRNRHAFTGGGRREVEPERRDAVLHEAYGDRGLSRDLVVGVAQLNAKDVVLHVDEGCRG